MYKIYLSAILLVIPSLSFATEIADKPNLDEIEVPKKYEKTFPIWAQEAIDLGYELPNPYGIGITYMSMEQPLFVDNVSFSGLGETIDDRVTIKGNEAYQDSKTVTLRADLWVLPFFNVYGILGKTKGSSIANVRVEVDILPPFKPIESDPFDFELNFEGLTYGIGTTIAGGVGDWFALIDINYTKTDLDILDGEISSLVLAPRVGYQFKIYDRNTQVWIGGMYQDVDQSFAGYLVDIGIPISGAKFQVDQHLAEKWNGVFGGQMTIGNGFDLLLEAGFGTRTSFMAGVGYRF